MINLPIKQRLNFLSKTLVMVVVTIACCAGTILYSVQHPEMLAKHDVYAARNFSSTPVSHLVPAAGSLSDEAFFQQKTLPFIQKYCLDCHSGNDAESDLTFEHFDSFDKMVADLDSWSTIYDAIESRYMPPEDAPQPTDESRQEIEDWISKTIRAQATSIPKCLVRRMNRFEYENTIDSLMRFERHAFYNAKRILRTTDYFRPETGKMPRYVLALTHFTYGHRRKPSLPGLGNPPSDPPVEHGFTNDQSSLSTSPLLIEKYFELADSMLNSSRFHLRTPLWREMFTFPRWRLMPEARKHAHEQLQRFLPRAFRRPISQTELSLFTELFDSEYAATANYTEAMKTTVSAILVSPGFLFRDDLAQSSDGFRHNPDFALASRLSYFMWGTMPDDELFAAAEKGELSSPQELARQVDRMLKDRKIKNFATDFGMQWLRLSKVNSAMPDEDTFPAYFARRMAPPGVSMMVEQLLLFETVMVEDRSIMDFIKPDFAYLNRPLMDWYEFNPKKVLGYSPDFEMFEDFFRVKLPHHHRGGIVTSGAMLLSTSTPVRTSPVYRGAWIMDVVFNRPPPSPPGNVPALDGDGAEHETKFTNVRQRLERHREDPACANCHDRIDPAGFALENFDAVGRWRKRYVDGGKIDASGTVKGLEFTGPATLKESIYREQTMFVRGFVEHVMKYALGRGLKAADENEIERITQVVIERGCQFSEVVKQVVLSRQFTQITDSIESQVSTN